MPPDRLTGTLPVVPDGSIVGSGPFSEAADLTSLRERPERFLNRELSWLDFNERVLAIAADSSVPVLERAKFCAIFSHNLDEFFQVRVAGLKDQLAAGVTRTTPDGRTAAQQLLESRDRIVELTARLEDVFVNEIAPTLAAHGVVLSSWDELDEDDRKYLVDVFDRRIFPVLTPLAVDPGHPFPYISNLSLNLAVIVSDPVTGQRRFARVKVPPVLPRFVVLPDGERFVPLEQVIAAHLDRLFEGMDIEYHFPFRVTRNADLTLEEEEADDLLVAVELELRRRRFGRAVRLEIDTRMTDEVRELLVRELDVGEDDVYELLGPLDLAGLWALQDLERPDLKDEPWTPVTQPRLQPSEEGDAVDILGTIRHEDVLVHHPYDSFATSVEEFFREAAADPDVLTIKTTLYRTTGDSPIVNSLIRAVERGKQVAVLVELKARFDEAANIEWARALEEAGVHVTYGLMGLKTHAKTALVVRDEPDGLRRYCHIGTGNYNSLTAKIYEDIGLLTGDERIGADLSQLFNFLTGYGRNVDYRRLLVAPHSLRPSLLSLIQGETRRGARGRIVMKMNSLVDPAMIDALYEASQNGVEIDLVVRGICCLRPGVPGLSERIRVRSIVGRYLEHARIYFFGNGAGKGKPTYYIGSADLMPRNLDHRVEALVPVRDPSIQGRLQEVFDVNLADDVLAWRLDGTGGWHRVCDEAPRGAADALGGSMAGERADRRHAERVNTHERLQELALERSRRSPRRDG